MPTAASFQQEDCFGFLFTLLRLYVNRRGMGVVLGSRFRVRLGPQATREPYICFVSAGRRHIIRDAEIAGPPDLAVEIIAADRGRRYGSRIPHYEQAGVPEVWVVDIGQRQVQQMFLDGGAYREAVLSDGDILRSRAIPGFRLSVSLLFSPPGLYPSEWSILQEMLPVEADGRR